MNNTITITECKNGHIIVHGWEDGKGNEHKDMWVVESNNVKRVSEIVYNLLPKG